MPCIIEKNSKITRNMEKTTKDIIDIFLSIVDNYGDMGFACEYIQAMQFTYPNQFQYIVWVDNKNLFENFVRQSHICDITIVDIVDF
jgi:hypothetical protein